MKEYCSVFTCWTIMIVSLLIAILCSVVRFCCRNCGIWYRFGGCNESAAHSTTEPSRAWLLEVVVDRICIVLWGFRRLHEVEVPPYLLGPSLFYLLLYLENRGMLYLDLMSLGKAHVIYFIMCPLVLDIAKWGHCSKGLCASCFDFRMN